MAFVSADKNGSASAAVTVTAPAGILDGHILVAHVAAWRSGAPPTGIGFPAGFAVWYERVPTNTNYRVAIGWARASSESGNYAFTAGSAAETQAGICVYSGRLAAGDPLDVGSDTLYQTNDTNVRGAGVTIATAGSDLVYAGFSYSGPLTLAAPSGMTSRASDDSLSSIEMADLVNQATGATGNKDGTAGASVTLNKHAFLVALKPAAAAPAFTPRAILL